MVYKDKTGLYGTLGLDHIRNGEQIASLKIPNTIMNVGKSSTASFLAGDVTAASEFDFISIGTSGIAAAAAQTALGSEQVKVATTSSQTTTTTSNDTATFIGSFGISGTKGIQEAGIFNAAGVDTGSMLARTTFSVLNVISGDAINATWDVTVA